MTQIELEQSEHEDIYGDNYAHIAQVAVDVPGLKPAFHRPDGMIHRPSNLGDLAEQVKTIFAEKPWYRPLLRDIRQGKKSAVFVTVLGGITIFVAATAGFEFGVRHGQDLRNLPRILKRKR